MEKDIESLEKVQRRLIRMLSNVRGSTYEEKLKDAGLTLLRDRRERGDLIEAFKTINGFNNVDKHAWFEIPDPERIRQSTRSSSAIDDNGEEVDRISLTRERARTDLRNQSYRFRTSRSWSLVPDAVRNSKTINGFKNSYDAWKQKPQTL